MREQIAQLEAALPNLGKSAEFARSLIAQFRRRGLSPKQVEWVNKLIQPRPAAVQIGSLNRVVEMFGRAAKTLKHPAILLASDSLGTIRLSVAGPASQHPGTINVASPGSFENRTWFGRIMQDGTYQPSPKADAGIAALLTRFAADPATVAAEHGRLTGNCSFCGRNLTDERSTSVGYGPVCAKRFGLEWGH